MKRNVKLGNFDLIQIYNTLIGPDHFFETADILL